MKILPEPKNICPSEWHGPDMIISTLLFAKLFHFKYKSEARELGNRYQIKDILHKFKKRTIKKNTPSINYFGQPPDGVNYLLMIFQRVEMKMNLAKSYSKYFNGGFQILHHKGAWRKNSSVLGKEKMGYPEALKTAFFAQILTLRNKEPILQ